MTHTVNMIDVCSRDLNQYELLRVNNTIMFIFTPKQTLVVTPFHLFKIVYNHRNYIKRLTCLREAVENGRIKNIVDLFGYCSLRPGPNSQMYGLELVRVEPSWVK